MKQRWNQVINFIGLSGVGWIFDFVVYTILGLFSTTVFINNMVSSCVGVTFVFWFSTRTIFQNNSKIPLKVKYALYLVYQFVLIILISNVLSMVNDWIILHITIDIVHRLSKVMAKIIVTPITMILNFIVMKGLMEKI